jgi:hypothetical protein
MAIERLSTILSGVAGQYFVAAELSRLGYIATLTLRNTRGVDLLVARGDATKSVGVQVKTNQGRTRSWLLESKAESVAADNIVYVFVNLNGDESPSFHIVPSDVVAQFCREKHAEWIASPKRNGEPRKDSAMRKFVDEEGEFLNMWSHLKL